MNLTISNLSKTYSNGGHALNDVSLSIPNGLFGLLGPNGAGKSTLMRTIATLQQADEGEIISFCKANLASYKKPRSVDFVTSLPRTGAEKVAKKKLREKYWAGFERKVH